MIDDDMTFGIAESNVTALAFRMRLSGRRQRERYAAAHAYFSDHPIRAELEQAVVDRIMASIDRWAKRHVRRRGYVEVSGATIMSGDAPYDTLFGDPDERRVRVSIRCIPGDVAAIIDPDGRGIRIADGMYVIRYPVPKSADNEIAKGA